MEKTLTIVQINDTHSYLESHQEIFYEGEQPVFRKAGGYARIQKIVNELRQEGPVMLLDNGDTIHGTYEAVATKGWNMIPILNAMGIDAMTFHWDSGYGPENLKQIGKELHYPILAGNVYDEATNELAFKPYRLFDVDGLSVGVIGLACNILDKTMAPHFSEGIYLTMGDKELPGYIAELKEQGAQLIILLSHLGFPQDIQLLSEVKGIDICLSGHTHNRVEAPLQIGTATLIQSGSHGSFIGKLEVYFEDNQLQKIDHQLLEINEDIPEDAELKAKIDAALSPYRAELDVRVGKTEVDLHRGYNLETPMDNFLLEAIRHHTGSDVTFSNGWRYGAPIVKGDITLRELYQIIPMNPPLSTAELTGAEIWQMLEDNMENTYSHNPYSQMGGYLKRAHGLHAYFKVENPKGTRLQKLFIGGQAVELEKVYTVGYVTYQGVPKKYGRNHQNLAMKAVAAMKSFLDEKGPYRSGMNETFRLI